MSTLFWITDAQMARLQPYFPKSHGKPRLDSRRVLSGIIFINRNELRWSDVPREMLPDRFEPVSVFRRKRELMRNKSAATRQEQRFGSFRNILANSGAFPD